MASDQQLNATIILQVLLEVERQGPIRTVELLDEVEPDLAGFVTERLSDIYHCLLSLRGKPKATQKAYRRIQLLVAVVISALRQSHYELWRSLQGNGPLAQLDPSLGHQPTEGEEPERS